MPFASIVALVIVTATGCGRISYDPAGGAAPADASVPGDDGGTDAPPDVDAGPGDGGPCVLPTLALPPIPTAPFGPPTRIDELSSVDFEDDPSLTADLLEIYFQSDRGGTSRIWRSVRADRADLWPAPTPVVELDAFEANTPKISRDGLTLHFAAPPAAGAQPNLYVATRTDRGAAFGAPAPIEELATAESETGAATFLMGRGVVFFSTRPGGPGGGDLFQATGSGVDCSGGYADVAPLQGGVNTEGGEANPWMREDGRAIVYAGSRPEGTGAGDIWVATRASPTAPFDPPVELETIDSTNVDDDPWMNDEMNVVFFMSARTGSADLYYATR